MTKTFENHDFEKIVSRYDSEEVFANISENSIHKA